jgi:exonuclease VII large subunit
MENLDWDSIPLEVVKKEIPKVISSSVSSVQQEDEKAKAVKIKKLKEKRKQERLEEEQERLEEEQERLEEEILEKEMQERKEIQRKEKEAEQKRKEIRKVINMLEQEKCDIDGETNKLIDIIKSRQIKQAQLNMAVAQYEQLSDINWQLSFDAAKR